MKRILITSLFLFIAITPIVLFGANGEYVPLESLPIAAPASSTNMATYVQGMSQLAIIAAIILAIIFIIWGGVEYVSTDAWYGKTEGKSRIKNALIGLLLAIMAFVILKTINPNILKINLELSAPRVNTNINSDEYQYCGLMKTKITVRSEFGSAIPGGIGGTGSESSGAIPGETGAETAEFRICGGKFSSLIRAHDDCRVRLFRAVRLDPKNNSILSDCLPINYQS